MELDIKKAFLASFSEEKWFIKLIFPVIISACFLVLDKNLHISKSIQIIAMFCLAIPYLVLWGFFTQFQHNEIHNKSELLPTLHSNIKDYFIYGINLTGIGLVYIIFLAIILLSIIPFFLLKANVIILVLLAIMYVCIAIFSVIVLIFSECSYADNFCFQDAFKFKYILKLMANVKFEIFILLFISLLLSCTLKLVLIFTNFILIFYPFIRVFIKLTGYNLAAQIYRIAKSRLENKEVATQK